MAGVAAEQQRTDHLRFQPASHRKGSLLYFCSVSTACSLQSALIRPPGCSRLSLQGMVTENHSVNNEFHCLVVSYQSDCLKEVCNGVNVISFTKVLKCL